MSNPLSSRILETMKNSEILRILMPERTKQIALAWSILRSAELSEDVYQDMLAKVFDSEFTFEGPQHLRDWSWKVLRNRCYELIRQQKYQARLLDTSVLELVDSELEERRVSQLPQRAAALRDCIQQLSERSREMIKMRYFEGLRGKQVAERLGRQPDAVYKSLQRIYVTLAQCIERKLTSSERGDSWV